MKTILNHPLRRDAAAFWWLGQVGYIVRSGDIALVIDPYLSDSAAGERKRFARLFPPPVAAADLRVDVCLITHDHLDHLDPDTLLPMPAKRSTWFVAPRLAARRLADLGIPARRIIPLNAGDSRQVGGVDIRGVFALPTGPEVIDTTGYLLRFPNGRTLYHTSDTMFHPLVLAAAPRRPEVMLVPINGKWGNPGPEQAADFASAVQPRAVIPNHYDLMALNAENPETFRWYCEQRGIGDRCQLATRMEPWAWR